MDQPVKYPFLILMVIPAYGLSYKWQALQHNSYKMQPDDMPDPDDFDEEDTWEEGLTEMDRRRHVSKEDELDLIEDEDDSFVDEFDEEE